MPLQAAINRPFGRQLPQAPGTGVSITRTLENTAGNLQATAADSISCHQFTDGVSTSSSSSRPSGQPEIVGVAKQPSANNKMADIKAHIIALRHMVLIN